MGKEKKPDPKQKKPKESGVMKATAKKKAGHKKWTKGKAKEKVDHAVFLSKEDYEKLMLGIPRIGKHISASQIVQKYKVVGSIARMLLKRLVATGAIKAVETHSKQGLYTQVIVPVQKTAAQVETKEGGKDQGKGKKDGGKKKAEAAAGGAAPQKQKQPKAKKEEKEKAVA